MYNYLLHLQTYLNIRRKELINSVNFNRTQHYTKFIILCEPRSGSTLLHTYLNYHPNIKSYGEVLRERIEHSNTTFPNLLEASIFTPHSKWLKAIGLKLFYAYYNHKVYGEYFDQIIKDQHIKVIHLTRKDILELYVSLKIAERTNLWSSVKISSQKSTPQLHVDCLDFKQFALTYIKQQKEFKRLFKGHEILTIQYEDLHKNPDVVLQHVQEFLGVVQKKLFSLLQKQNTQDVRLLISNYEEVHLIVWQIQNENMTR